MLAALQKNLMASLLHYRSWQGDFHHPMWSVWPIARVALGTLLWGPLWRRILFWGMYANGLLLFSMFFFGAYCSPGWRRSFKFPRTS